MRQVDQIACLAVAQVDSRGLATEDGLGPDCLRRDAAEQGLVARLSRPEPLTSSCHFSVKSASASVSDMEAPLLARADHGVVTPVRPDCLPYSIADSKVVCMYHTCG